MALAWAQPEGVDILLFQEAESSWFAFIKEAENEDGQDDAIEADVLAVATAMEASGFAKPRKAEGVTEDQLVLTNLTPSQSLMARRFVSVLETAMQARTEITRQSKLARAKMFGNSNGIRGSAGMVKAKLLVAVVSCDHVSPYTGFC